MYMEEKRDIIMQQSRVLCCVTHVKLGQKTAKKSRLHCSADK